MDVAATKDIGKIVEYSPNLIYVYDQVQQRNEYTNRCIGEKLGYSSDEIKDMGTALMPRIIHPEDLPKVLMHFADICELEDGEISAIEYRVLHRDGHWLWLLSHDTVFRRDDQNRVTHHIGAASDITAQKEAEAEAIAAQLKESITNEELKEFAYAISHDMKAPSNTLKLIFTELQEELSCNQESPEGLLLGIANTTIDRMQQLVEDVLHYTQVIGQELRFEKVDLNALLHELTVILKAEIREQDAQISVDPMPIVTGSQTQLMILFKNLLSNALKFSRPNVDPVVHVLAEKGKNPGSYVIKVQDNGVGIPEERMDQIFKMFKKLNSEAEHNGTGLGLAACRRIASNHNSNILVTSVVGEGSSFSVELKAA